MEGRPGVEAENQRPSSCRLIVAALLVVVVLYAGYEAAERILLKGGDPETLRWLHMARGILSSLLVGGVFVVALARGTRAPPHRSIPIHFGPMADGPAAPDLKAENLWLVRLRWIASVAALAAVGAGIAANLFPETPVITLLAATAALPLGNALFLAWSRRTRRPKEVLQVQIGFDLVILSVLIHYTGGIQNPLIFLFAFHVILAGILLARRDAFAVSLLALILVGSLALREMTGLLPRYPIAGVPVIGDRPLYVAGVTVALGVVLLGTAAFTTMIVDLLRQREEQLTQAGKMAALGEISAALAHEINNPLAIISGKIDTVLRNDDRLTEASRRDLGKVAHHAGRIAAITRGLLSYARPSCAPREPADLDRAVQEALELVGARAKTQGVRIEVDPWPELPKFLGNHAEISQVVLNLANNALDAMPSGGVLELRTESHDGLVCLHVRDSGNGMTPEVLRRLFAPFFTSRADRGGTGLGLAYCYGVVRSHGGRIEAESRPGEGSLFRVLLPALAQEEAAR